MKRRNNPFKLFAYFLYLVFFRNTPEDYRPYALFFPWVRNKLTRMAITTCGKNIRVKSGADYSPFIHVGNESELGTRCMIQSNVTIGSHVIMGPDVKIYSRNHAFELLDVPIQKQGKTIHETIIGDDVWIGANSVILPGVVVGSHSIIAAGAVVTKNVPERSIFGGNPAKLIRTRDNKSG